jgi:4-amino-4-deoxy-L-arabinose transferase-like glycosyltransferase
MKLLAWPDLALTLVLALVAFIPRWVLLHQLDIVTDEAVYVPVGRLDVSLLAHGHLLAPEWLVNYEAPALPKLLMGLAAALAGFVQPSLGMVQAARLPGAIISALALALLYPLSKPIFGRWPALLGALCLALSPWYSYFSSIAYLDMYAASFVNLAFVTLWHARQRPRLYLLVGVLLGLGFACKYTAALALPGMLAFVWYQSRLGDSSASGQKRLPWKMLGLAALCGLAALYLADPAIWVNPVIRLANSIGFQLGHAEQGHRTFFAGSYSGHIPPGAVFLILLIKVSAFVVLPALLFLPWAAARLARHRRQPAPENAPLAFGLCWLGGLLLPFSFLSIVVGTHYMLPLAAPVCLVGAYTLLRALNGAAAWLLRAQTTRLQTQPAPVDQAGQVATRPAASKTSLAADYPASRWLSRPVLAQAFVLALAAVLLVVPHALGLVSAPQAEGYTSELFPSENGLLQVAYPGYADGVQWLQVHARVPGSVGLVSLPDALNYWLAARQDLQSARLPLRAATPTELAGDEYLVWPMHLIQRGYPPPPEWAGKVVHAVMGGATIYCLILALHPASVDI